MATNPLNILYVASEVEGLIKSGGLADVAKALPKALQDKGQNVKITLPAYSAIAGRDEAEIVLDTQLEHWPHTPYKVRALSIGGVEALGIECSQYFDRDSLYAENNEAYADNGERFAFFSAACLDMLAKLNYQPEVIHANDWHTGLVPFLLKVRYGQDDFFANTHSVISIHNAVFKGVFSYRELECISELYQHRFLNIEVSHDHVSMLKAGVAYADKINGVSPNYAAELLTELGAHGMAADFQHRQADLCGIVNGCDYSEWDPETDKYIPQNYKANRNSMVRGKKACKRALQDEVDLPQKDVAVYGMVCRLTNQKGLHYLTPILDKFLRSDVQVVIVGTGDPVIAAELHAIAKANPEKFAFVEAYSNKLAHWVEAASDFFLMPSEFEPCGLNQIYSMAYGTLPIVRAVGGLKDTVIDYEETPQVATGFSFQDPCALQLLITLQQTLLLYTQQPNEVKRLQLNAMACDFNWLESAEQYLEMYKSAVTSTMSEKAHTH